jgi:hypothetical protein
MSGASAMRNAAGLTHAPFPVLARGDLEQFSAWRASKVCLRRNVAALLGKLFSPFVTV